MSIALIYNITKYIRRWTGGDIFLKIICQYGIRVFEFFLYMVFPLDLIPISLLANLKEHNFQFRFTTSIFAM